MKVKTDKLKLSTLMYAVICVLFLLNTSTVYFVRKFNMFVVLLSVVLMGYNFVAACGCKLKFRRQEMNTIILYVVSVAVLVVFWHHFTLYYIYVLCILFPNIYLLLKLLGQKNRLQEFIGIFVGIGGIVAIASLFFWIFGSTFQILHPTGMVDNDWGGQIRSVKTYYQIYFETQNASIDIGGIHLGVKNNAIFPEAPICCFVFIVFFLLNELTERKNKKFYRVLYAITILSTLTTVGILFTSMLFIYFVSKIPAKKKRYKVLKGAIYVLAILACLFLCLNVLREKGATHSGIVRYSKIVDEFRAFVHSPLTGHGFNTYTNGSSNSVTALLADGGILLWGMYYFPLLHMVYRDLKNRRINYIAGIYMAVFMFTVVQYTPMCIFMILLMRYLYDEKEVRHHDIRNHSGIQ